MPTDKRPRVVVTGAARHLGRHLADAVRADQLVFAIADCSQAECGAPLDPRITWYRADTTDPDAVSAAVRSIVESGGVDVVIFLASGEDREDAAGEARRQADRAGLRTVLAACLTLKPRRVIVAAPEGAGAIDDLLSAEERQQVAPGLPVSSIQFVRRPRILITGASGFIGRHMLEAVKEDYEVIAFARSSQARCGVPVHRHVTWHQVELADREALTAACDRVLKGGGIDYVLHLAAYYDFNSQDDPEYWRTNVVGLKNLLEECRRLKPRRFLFASSVAASEFPPRGSRLSEESPPDGRHVYAITKRLGEEMLPEYADDFASIVIRFAAMFSDWCEYPPLFVRIETWLSKVWHRRVLGGRGSFAVPYLHIRDGQKFILRLLGRADDLPPGQVVLASADGAVSLRQLFELATKHFHGRQHRALYLPKLVCALGLHMRDLSGRALGTRPFERPWMAKYIDRQLSVDIRRTCELLDWRPRPRLELARRLPFMIENLKSNPVEWHRRNRAVLEEVFPTTNLRIHRLIERHEGAIEEELTRVMDDPAAAGFVRHRELPEDERAWYRRTALQKVMNTVCTRDPSVFIGFCDELAARRHAQGFMAGEVCETLEALRGACEWVVLADEAAAEFEGEIRDSLTTLTQFGCDQVEESFEEIREASASFD